MADAGPDYSVERRRLAFQKMEHEQTIRKGSARIAEIEDQKKINIARAELQNDELDAESRIIRTNELSLKKSIADIEKRLEQMATGPTG